MLVRSAVVRLRASVLSLIMLVVVTASGEAQGDRVNKIVALLEAGKPVFGIFSGPKTPESAMAIAETEAIELVEHHVTIEGLGHSPQRDDHVAHSSSRGAGILGIQRQRYYPANAFRD